MLGFEEEDFLCRICRRAAVPHEVEHMALSVAERLAQCREGGGRGRENLEAGRRAHRLPQVGEFVGQVELRQEARIGGHGENADGCGAGRCVYGARHHEIPNNGPPTKEG